MDIKACLFLFVSRILKNIRQEILIILFNLLSVQTNKISLKSNESSQVFGSPNITVRICHFQPFNRSPLRSFTWRATSSPITSYQFITCCLINIYCWSFNSLTRNIGQISAEWRYLTYGYIIINFKWRRQSKANIRGFSNKK